MSDFTPTLYLKNKCPFCFKVRVALLEAGLADEVEILEFKPGTPEEDAMKSELAPHFEKVTFPSAQVAPGEYINDSDAVVAHFVEGAGMRVEDLETLAAYVEGPFQSISNLYRENAQLKKQLEGDA